MEELQQQQQRTVEQEKVEKQDPPKVKAKAKALATIVEDHIWLPIVLQNRRAKAKDRQEDALYVEVTISRHVAQVKARQHLARRKAKAKACRPASSNAIRVKDMATEPQNAPATTAKARAKRTTVEKAKEHFKSRRRGKIAPGAAPTGKLETTGRIRRLKPRVRTPGA